MAAHAEGRVEQLLRRRVEDSGGLCLKLTDRKGIPDRLCVWPGRPPVFCEVKNGSAGRLSRIQEYWSSRLVARGFRYEVVRDSDDVSRVVTYGAA